jgi:hypothetical protein
MGRGMGTVDRCGGVRGCGSCPAHDHPPQPSTPFAVAFGFLAGVEAQDNSSKIKNLGTDKKQRAQEY